MNTLAARLRATRCRLCTAGLRPIATSRTTTAQGDLIRRTRRSVSTRSDSRPPLFEARSAVIAGLKDSASSGEALLDLVIRDDASSEAWGIVGPAAERGGAVKAAIVKNLLGLTQVQIRNREGKTMKQDHSHPFLQGGSMTASQSIQLVSFSARLSAVGSAGSNDFVNFSARYGAIREDDRVTVFEDILNKMGTKTGLVAKIALAHDALMDPEEEQQRDYEEGGLNRLPWASAEAETRARHLAKDNVEKIESLAPLLDLSGGDPPLLQRPLIALSNGQTRRARILSALCVGCEVLVLEEPFTGLDPPTRKSLTRLLAQLHSRRHPRIICVLREQDELPEFITHVLSIGDEGEVLFQGPLKQLSGSDRVQSHTSRHRQHPNGGYHLLKDQASQGIGRGDESDAPVVAMQDVTVAYHDKKVLDSVSLCLPRGSTTILVGDNGSGKTTLLSLLLGSHPRSFSIPATDLRLFDKGRAEPSNATPLLLRRTGQLSPELVNAFPRRAIERGGLTVQEAIGTGFEGIFTRRPLSPEQEHRIQCLVKEYSSVLSSGRSGTADTTMDGGKDPAEQDVNVQRLLSAGFSSLTPGSQAVVLFLRSIVHRPELLILDEPFQGMSSAQVSLIRRRLDGHGDAEPNMDSHQQSEIEKDAEWARRRAVVVVSHFEDEWPLNAGRLVRLSEGRVTETI
ncbi:unnamed protein product [Parajaminaea phylloscopi]